MNRIAQTLQQLKTQNKKAVIPYLTPEFPIKGTTVPLILAFEQAGASLIEIGVPFSDPLADGPTIQRSSDVAIKNGVTVKRVLQLVDEARKRTNIPLILMGYINPILNYGMEKFISDARSAGVDGLIIPDLPPEESEEFRSHSKKYGISNVFLIAPTSPDERIRYVDTLSTDFIYCVSVTGVTGARNSFGGGFEEYLARVKKNTSKPFVVGFGIKSQEQVQNVTKYADGIVVASALIDSIGKKDNIEEIASTAKNFLLSLV